MVLFSKSGTMITNNSVIANSIQYPLHKERQA